MNLDPGTTIRERTVKARGGGAQMLLAIRATAHSHPGVWRNAALDNIGILDSLRVLLKAIVGLI